MTKFLSDCLEAPEPFFSQGVRRLEAGSGHPSTDIRLSLEVERSSRNKLRLLGLDPDDTTPQELYFHLQERVRQDDAKLVKVLRTQAARHVSAEGDIAAGIVHVLKTTTDSRRGFAFKPARFKALIKKSPPKKAMKQLGYRSLESFLKKESAPAILAAARLYESEAWHNRLNEQYKKLKPSDFEDRPIGIFTPEGDRWRRLSADAVGRHRHNLMSLHELGTLIVLPLPQDAPAGTTTACLGLALHELNEIRAAGTYLKMCQVRPDFGQLVQAVAHDEARLQSPLLDTTIPWQLVQRYYSRLRRLGHSFADPHLQLEEIAWHPVETTLKAIEPAFEFWSGSAHLAVLHGRQPVPFNLLDAALNCCNQLNFAERLTHYFRDSLWHELLLRYLRPDIVEQSLAQQLQPKLASQEALV